MCLLLFVVQIHAPSRQFISSFYRDILGTLVAVDLSLDVSQFVEADMIAGATRLRNRLATTQGYIVPDVEVVSEVTWEKW